jgi:hypothetical protein
MVVLLMISEARLGLPENERSVPGYAVKVSLSSPWIARFPVLFPWR